MSTITARIRRVRRGRITALAIAAVLFVEGLAILMYLLFANARITDPLILVYPFVWVNVGLGAILATTPPPTSTRRRRGALVVGIGYFLALGIAGGLVSPGHAFHGHSHGSGFRIAMTTLPPGWAPTVLYAGDLVNLSLIPFKVIGYIALAYLVYVTVLETAGSAFAGIVGLFSCVSCTWPILGMVVTGVFGSTSALAVAATNQPYGLSTLVFLSAVGLLYWRPFVR